MDEHAVLEFWFQELQPQQWWRADPLLDAAIATRFGSVHTLAVAGGLAPWRATPEGRLAEILVLDQFSRNMFRGDPRAFAADPLALALAQEAVASGVDRALPVEQRAFLYMPYMHSESARIHETALVLFSEPGLERSLVSEMKHKAVIDRFGRYPQRNAALGRASTAEEAEFLQSGSATF